MSLVAPCHALPLVLAALSGCNQLYGIDETMAVIPLDAQDVDLDDDGILDVIDICPAIANPLQEDMDGDRIGDACDPCPTGANHNEDGDTLLDGCDNCPHVANDDQANADGDALGDACDLDGASQVRERFDGFATLAADWIPGETEWEIHADAARPISKPADSDSGMWNRHVEVNGVWSIETRFHGAPADTNYAGIQARSGDGSPAYLCYAQYNAPDWQLGGNNAGPLTISVPNNTIVIRMSYDGANVHCSGHGVDVVLNIISFGKAYPGLRSNTTAFEFDYIDAVETP